MADEPNRTISVRPSKMMFPRLEQLARELGKSEGQVLLESAQAVLEMVETGKNFVPRLVTVARALRESGVSFADHPQDMGESSPAKSSFPEASDAGEKTKNGKLPPKRKVSTRLLPSDIREVSFYEDDTIEAGRATGTSCGNAPGKITVPPDWNLPVDFVVKVHGDSMSGFIEDGEMAAFTHATTAPNGQVVAALVEGQMMIKLFNDPGKGVPELHSINPDYPPILCTSEVRVQGLYQGKFPLPNTPKRAGKKK